MRKRNKLYTASKWNQPLFMPDNIFEDGGNLVWDRVASKAYGDNYGNNGFTLEDYQNSKNVFGISKVNNPFSKGNLTNTFSSNGMGNILKGGLASTLGSAVGSLGNKLISGGLDSGAGKAITGVGSAVGSAIGTVNPLLGGAVSAASGIIGGGINALFGSKLNNEKISEIEDNNNAMNSIVVDNSNIDSIENQWSNQDFGSGFTKSDIGKDGLFSNKAKNKYRELQKQQDIARNRVLTSYGNAINAADTQSDLNVFANYAAFGGPLDSVFVNQGGGGAIDYGFMSDYLTIRNNANQAKNKISTNAFGNLPVTPLSTFALGGDMQVNGGDFSNGLTHIDAGLSHQENPNGGVQVGTSRDNGQPNLVEEGETIFDDYVYSKRIKADQQTKKKFHVSKNADISFADLSKKLEKESEERPNDPISMAGLVKQMHDLAGEQERQKGEEQQREAEEAFNQLPPEQQQTIMQQIAMEEQQAQEQQMQGGVQPPMEGQQEPQQMVDENMQQQMNPQIQEGSEEQINACGGKMNRFDKGGDLKKKIYGLLGLHTDSDFDKWAYDQKLDKITDWENILKNKQFLDVISGVNPALSDVISKGYDFGAFVPSKTGKLTFDFTHGGWGKEDYDAWNGSTDAAWKEAVEKGLVKEGMNSDEIGKALSQTDAYKRGSDWLKADENNRLTYLQSILNSQDAPQDARDYAAKYVDSNGWLKDAKRDYQTIFEDPNGTGVRNTHPGTYWKTPNEILRDKQSGNYVINGDGTVEPIYNDVPKDWTSAGTYNWQDEGSDYTYNYYKRPTTGTPTNGGNGSPEEEIVPVHKPTWGRYAGLAGPLVGLGLQALGMGKPDYSRMDAAVEAASGSPALASYKPIGNYLTYRPMDIWYEQNRMNANSRATDRAILNNSSPIGTKTAGLLANGYNSQIASGNLYRQALEYNDAQRQKVAEFNRGTNQWNSDAFNKVSMANADTINRNRQFRSSLTMNAAQQRLASDANWYGSIYGNVSNAFKGLSDYGRENEQFNLISDMTNSGIFGVMNPDSPLGRRVMKRKKK